MRALMQLLLWRAFLARRPVAAPICPRTVYSHLLQLPPNLYIEAPALNNDAAVAAAPWGRNRRSMRAAACTSFDSTTRKPFCRCFVQSTSTTTPSTVWPASLIVTFTRFFSVRCSVPSHSLSLLLDSLACVAQCHLPNLTRCSSHSLWLLIDS